MDRTLLLWIHGQHHPILTTVMMAISTSGEAAICWWLLGLLLLLRKHPLAATMLLAFVLASVIGVVFTNLPQLLWFRPRPYLYLDGIHQLGFRWENSSFPSGHTVNSFCGAVIFGAGGGRLRVVLLSFAALMGVSRLYAGMHHPSDVLFAAFAGTLCGMVSWKLTRFLQGRWTERRERRLRMPLPVKASDSHEDSNG